MFYGKLIHYFIRLSGALLLAAATMLFLSNWAGNDLAQPKDPLFVISIRSIIWIAASLLLVVAMLCLFGKPRAGTMVWLAWLAMQFWLYKAGLWLSGFQNATIPLGSLPDAFSLTPASANNMANVLFGSALAGSLLFLLWPWWMKRKSPELARESFKISCVHCGGHIAFSKNWIGRQTACPHCLQSIVISKT